MGSSVVPDTPVPPQVSLLQPLAREEEEEEKLQEAKKKQVWVFLCENVILCWQGSLGGSDRGWGA